MIFGQNMKKNSKKILIVFTFIFLIVGLLFFVNKKQEKILFKDSFDTIDSWKIYDYESEQNNKVVSTVCNYPRGFNDNTSLYIESVELNDIRVYKSISVDSNSCYRISVMVNASQGGEDGSGANISAIDCYEYVEIKETYGRWKELEAYVKTKSNQNSIKLSLGLGGYDNTSKGYAIFDDLIIEKIDEIPINKSTINLLSEEQKEEYTPNVYGKYIFAGLMGSIFIFSIAVYVKRKDLVLDKKIKLKRKDYIIIAVLTLICMAVSFYKLGDFSGAENFWKAGEIGEYVIVEFPESINVKRMAHYGNVLSKGYYEVSYLTEKGYKSAFTLGENIENQTKTRITKAKSFRWKYDNKINFVTQKVKIECKKPGWAINELAFFTKDENGEYERIPIKVTEINVSKLSVGTPDMLFDEQELVPDSYSYMVCTYWDETFFARSAYEQLQGLSVYEKTHPPLGKIIISLGITIFGMVPFGWRFMGTIFGVLLVPLMYLFGFKIFKNRKYAFIAAFLMMFDFMRFTHTRVATVDSYLTFFIICMYYFMYDYLEKNDNKFSLRVSLKPLLLSGIMFGLGAATKWSAIYAGGGLAFLFFLSNIIKFMHLNKKSKKAVKVWLKKIFIPTCLWCVLFFIVIPLTIYILSYIPYLPSHSGKNLFEIFIENTKYIFSFHSGLHSTHSYASKWYTWGLMLRPFQIYSNINLEENIIARIVSFGNPAIWWISMIFVFVSLFFTWRDKDKNGIILLVAYAFQYITWALISRTTYIYAYFTAIPFAILLLVYCIKKMDKGKKSTNAVIGIYLLIVVILFVMFFPSLTGMAVNKNYSDWLKWLPKW